MNQIEATAQKIRNAYQASRQAGEWMALAILREDTGATRPDFDAAITWLASNDDRFNLVPENNQKTLRPADREAAIRFGGQENHLACWF